MPAKSSAGAGAERARRKARPTPVSKQGPAKPATAKEAKADNKAEKSKTPKTAKTVSNAAAKPAALKTKAASAAQKKKPPVQTSIKTPRRPSTKRKTPAKVNTTHKTPDATPEAVIEASQEVTKAVAKPAARRKPAPKPISLVLKVLGTIDGELTKLEEHTGKSSQDRERASRALTQMVTSLEKTVDMQRQIQRDKSASTGPKDKEALRHADDMRRQLAERLERLTREKSAERASGSNRG